MSIFKPRKYYINDFPDYKEKLITWVKEKKYFSINIGPSWLIGTSKRKRRSIYQNILNKFIPISKEFYIYDLKYDLDLVKPYKDNLIKDRTRYKINFIKEGWEMYDSILYSPPIMKVITEIRGGVIGKCKYDELALSSILKYCRNPMVIGNASVGCGKKALNIAKTNEEDGIFYVIIETLNSGLSNITLVSNAKEILKLFEIAADNCSLSSNYRTFQIEVYKNIERTNLELS